MPAGRSPRCHCHCNSTTRSRAINDSCPSASLDYIIEPWFLGPGGEGPGGPEFNAWAKEAAAEHGTTFGTSLSDLPDPKQPRVALISGRTADNPRLLSECIAAGCKCIYLEKPGAPTVGELQGMMEEAEAAGIEVLMGYNKVGQCLARALSVAREPFASARPDAHGRLPFRHFVRSQSSSQNVCKYVRKTREFAETVPGSQVTFVSNNAYE